MEQPLGNDRCSRPSLPPPPSPSPSSPDAAAAAAVAATNNPHSFLIHTFSPVRHNTPENNQITTRRKRSRRMLFTVLTSSAVGLAGLLIAAPAPVDALVAPGSGSELGHLAARRLAGVSSNHHALARRKSNAHKKRQRCQQRPVSAASTPAPQPSSTDDNSGTNNYVGGNDNNNDNIINLPSNPATTTTAQPAPTENYTPPAPAGNGKLMLAWPNGPLWTDGHIDTQKMQQYFTGKASLYEHIHTYTYILC